MANGALSHIRVLDLSRVLAGPWATQVLADLGAEVIKVERPGTGDDTRGWGPPWLREESGESAYFVSTNRGKRSVTIDIARPEGQEIVRRVAAQSDVLVENYKAGTLDRYGLGHGPLAVLNPRLIYCSITGFGQTGPYRERAGYDFLVQAMGGLMSITGEPDGEPMKVGVAITDILTGMYAVTGILAALACREHSGRGQHVDLALLDHLAQVFADPQVRQRGMEIDAPHPLAGKVPMVRSPIRLSESPARSDIPPPLLGQHTAEVLKGLLRMDDDEVNALREKGVV